MSKFNIKKEREKLDFTQTELAEKIGVSLRTVQNHENGEVIPGSKYKILRNVFGDNIAQNNVHGDNINKDSSNTTDKFIELLKAKDEQINKLLEIISKSNK
jgi:DNA-binding XRE family transcriptional regulator